MRIAYLTRPSFLDASLMLIRALSELVEVYLLIELAPAAMKATVLNLDRLTPPKGLQLPENILDIRCMEKMVKYWGGARDVQFVVFTEKRSLNPLGWLQGKEVVKYLHRINPDVIHFDEVSIRTSVLSPFFPKARIIFTVHDAIPHSGEGNFRIDFARWLSYKRNSQYVMMNSHDREIFSKKYSIPIDSIAICRLGSYDIYKEWANGSRSNYANSILFFGRFSPYKGLEVLFRAMPDVAEAIPNVRLVAAGNPIQGYEIPPPPSLPNSGRIEVLPTHITSSELARLFQEAAVVVCPYIDATQSGVILTAYGFDKPVVATRVGGLPEYVWDGQTGYLVPPRDPVALANAIVTLLADKQKQMKMAANIKQMKKGVLSWDSIAERTVQVYQEIIDSRRRNVK